MLNDFNEILEGRKSVKGFDPDYKILEEMNEMIAKATKAPSSVNMQPGVLLWLKVMKRKLNCVH